MKKKNDKITIFYGDKKIDWAEAKKLCREKHVDKVELASRIINKWLKQIAEAEKEAFKNAG